MKYVESTYKILFYRAIDEPVDKEWIDWAIEMILAGFETENLLYLASFDLPDNQFKLKEVADKAFKELQLDHSDKESTIKNYVNYLVKAARDGHLDYFKALKILKDIYTSQAVLMYIQDFILLYWAKDDLNYADHQWYWEGANKDNIDAIIEAYFENWKID